MKVFLLILSFTVAVLIDTPLCALDPNSVYHDLREEETYGFSMHLFENGDYYRAITEAKRYIFLFPKGKNIEAMYRLIGDCYLMAKKWPEAARAYDDFLGRFPKSPGRWHVKFRKAICMVKSKEYRRAEGIFREIVDSGSSFVNDESIMWRILLLIRENRFSEIDDMLGDDRIKKAIGLKMGEINKRIHEKKNASYKSPLLAGVMSSILPGSGQIYNERFKDGIYSFILNALFMCGAYMAFEDENYALGGILVLFEAGWYTGNVYGAVSGAHKYNRKVDEDVFKRGLQSFGLLEHKIRKTPDVNVMFRFNF
jgi:hypothetical protein